MAKLRSSVSVSGSRIVAARARAALLLSAAFAMTGCSTANSLKQTFFGGPPAPEQTVLAGFVGGAVADEPSAALVARDVLAHGGNAADAAVALGMALAVTLPSRAGLGAGGACLAYDPRPRGPGQGRPQAVLFTSLPGGGSGASDRPAAVPMLARGLYLLHASYGKLPFEQLVTPAERMARFGTPVSRAFSQDLALVAGPLFQDPNARTTFADSTGQPLRAGATMTQPDLGATLAQLRVAGVGDLYQGALAQRLVTASAQAGGSVGAAALRGAIPKLAAPITLPAGDDVAAFLPPPADGGLAAAAAFSVLQMDSSATGLRVANARALAVAARWRQGGGNPMEVLQGPAQQASLPTLPASTSFVTLDRDGMAVACSESMNNLFGTGRIAPGTGILLAASPAAVPVPLLSAAIAWNQNLHAFRAEVGGSGQEGAPMAVADGLYNALHGAAAMPVAVPEPGRANVIACARYLPDSAGSCSFAVDPRTAGLAAGSSE